MYFYSRKPTSPIMKIALALYAFVLLNLNSHAQTNTVKRKYADTEPLIIRYRALCQNAWESNNSKLAYTYYDSITNCINHSYIGRYKFKTIDDKKFNVSKTKKPVFLTVAATWCGPCRAEIPALNKIVEEYADRIDFLVLFWDLKSDLTTLAPQYNNRIFLIPSTTKSLDKAHTIDIAGFRCITGYPSMFLINSHKQILSYQTGAAPTSYVDEKGITVTITEAEAFKANYMRLKEDMEFLLKDESVK
jgi:thiol-disulfide isomerase/thioredoxin